MVKKNLLLNKKAQISEALQDTVCLVIIAFLLIMLFIVSSAAFGWSRKETERVAIQQALAAQAHYSLQAWLQQRVEIDIEGKKENLTIADLIRLSVINKGYQSALEAERQRAFDPHYSYIFRIPSRQLEAHIEALEARLALASWFYIPSNQTILVVLQLKGLRSQNE